MILRSTDIRSAIRSRQRGLLLNPFRFGSSGSDPNFANVAMLLHMDGANDSTTFVDSSTFARTMTAVGNAKISTAQSKFGGASGVFDGTGDRVTTPYNANIDLTSDDFTIEGWFYALSLGASQALFAQRVTGGILFYFPGTELTTLRFLAAVGGTTYNVSLSCTTAFTTGSWKHFAVTRSGNTWRIFLDGVLEASTSVSGSISNLTVSTLAIGADTNGSLSVNGYIDDFRITKGVARYTANFTPPSAAFPDS